MSIVIRVEVRCDFCDNSKKAAKLINKIRYLRNGVPAPTVRPRRPVIEVGVPPDWRVRDPTGEVACPKCVKSQKLFGTKFADFEKEEQ